VRDITRHRATLFGEAGADFHMNAVLIEGWLKKWTPAASLAKQDEYCWNVEAPLVALQELPRRLFMHSDWSTYPLSRDGVEHPDWQNHFDDGVAVPWNKTKADA